MTGEHGGCCCNHDDPDDNHDQPDEIVQSPQILTLTEGAACCCGAKHKETSLPKDHAAHSTEVRSPS